MAIKSLELSNTGPFRPSPTGSGSSEAALNLGQPDIRMEFDERVNLFIGPNNSGKSTILYALYALTRHRVDSLAGGFLSGVLALGGPSWTSEKTAWFTIERYEQGQVVRGSFAQLQRPFEVGRTDPISWNQIVDNDGFVGYKRSDSDIDMGMQFPGVSYVIEHQENLYLLSSAHSIAQIHNSSHEFDREILNAIFDVLGEICESFPITLTGDTLDENTELLRDKSLEDIFVDHRNPEVITNFGHLGGYATETLDGVHPFADLSHGTLSTFAWVSRLVLGMGRRYNGDPEWKNRPGIFLIDELDAHVHPSWQRRIILTLHRHFPNVQIFASTHSPMIVAGLRKGQVHLLKRDETGRVVWSRNEQDIIGWTADEIYRTFMGIDDPTDERTARHAEELRELRNKDSLTPEDEARMQELRRLVNEDLLARGALNAQDERFDEMMRRFMANRMSDLSQDGV